MEKFPDELEPKLFFTQNLNSYSDYIEYLKIFKNISNKLNIYFFNIDHSTFFIPYEISLKNKTFGNFQFFLPLAVCYFLSSCSDLVQLCLINHLLLNIIKKNLKKKQNISIDLFIETVEELNGKNESDKIVLEIKKTARKSIFHNCKNKKTFFEGLESKSYIQNSTKSYVKTRSFIKTRSNLSRKSIFNNDSQKNLIKKLKSQKLNKSNKEIVKEVKEENDTKSSFSSSKQNSDSNSESRTETDSESYDSSSDSSFNEEHYNAKNPYEVQYSRIQHKFTLYEIEIERPGFYLKNGNFEDLKQQDLYLFLKNN